MTVKNAGAYAKSLVPLLITALYATQAALSDGRVTNTEWVGIATGLLTSLGAYLVPNQQKSIELQGVLRDFKPTEHPVNVNAAAPVTTVTPTAAAPAEPAPLIPPDA